MDNIKYMKEALKEARKAFNKREVPIGCVIVKDDKIISRAHNLRETKKSILTHAEVLCIDKACKKLKTWHLDGCSIYITLEPCPMCSGTIIQSRISRVFYGAKDLKGGACGSILNLFNYNFQNPKVEIIGGILEEESLVLLKSFFKELREEKKKIDTK